MFSFDWFVGGPLVYFAVALFVFKTAITVFKYLKMPRHLRWDLYPVPHQGSEGSKYQKVGFSELKPHKSLFHEIKEMGTEIIFIKRAYINNPNVWRFSFPLHMGLYFGFMFFFFLIVGAVFELNNISVGAESESVLALIVYYLTIATGVIGFAAGLFGSVMLLWMRTTDEDMRVMSEPVSFINLVVMILLFGTGLAAWGLADSSFDILRWHMADLIIFEPGSIDEPLIVLQILMCCAFLIYLPFSRMMHFVGKYFFYHNIMWDDEMMKQKSPMESDIAKYLQFKMTWSGPHIRKGESWADQVAKGFPKEGDQK